MTLADFLLARIADDEAEIHEAEAVIEDAGWWQIKRPRVLAECAAKRAIVSELQPGRHEDLGISQGTSEYLLSLLAVPYSDHPDYDESWRP